MCFSSGLSVSLRMKVCLMLDRAKTTSCKKYGPIKWSHRKEQSLRRREREKRHYVVYWGPHSRERWLTRTLKYFCCCCPPSVTTKIMILRIIGKYYPWLPGGTAKGLVQTQYKLGVLKLYKPTTVTKELSNPDDNDLSFSRERSLWISVGEPIPPPTKVYSMTKKKKKERNLGTRVGKNNNNKTETKVHTLTQSEIQKFTKRIIRTKDKRVPLALSTT